MVLLPAGGKFYKYAWVQVFFEHKHSKAFNVKDYYKKIHMRIPGVDNKDAVNTFSDKFNDKNGQKKITNGRWQINQTFSQAENIINIKQSKRPFTKTKLWGWKFWTVFFILSKCKMKVHWLALRTRLCWRKLGQWVELSCVLWRPRITQMV